jgi:hypothetical protein
MLTNYADFYTADGIKVWNPWYQIGIAKQPGQNCPHYYMQRWEPAFGADANGNPVPLTDWSANCSPNGQKFRLRIQKLQDDLGFYWRSYVLKEADLSLAFEADGDPSGASIGFTIADAEYSAEVIDEGDQSGGGNATRGKLESLYWFDANLAAIPAAIPAADRFCQLCGGAGPYNTNWLTDRAFEDWTDGF